ncbi:prolyl oligopeptidase family serine peptidase [Bifidobacterium choloepi]|uniref:Prolyl oligopeptidase family serine peptidase n=1 Tax=Bifidobacterium choloepi TaxID=2614131 RepID=A0A6I5NHA2_9BIFI|nr:prolyl oligopeptidase family serine peptidase [Bifidobacterium choloepi]NEG70594.1 prolyl oligopeptidase family serine peptidase [Bifidobacterium choloepi]
MTDVSAQSAATIHAIDEYPRLKARTVKFSCGAPRSATLLGDGSRMLFLRSDGPEDTVTSLWLSEFAGSPLAHHEIKLADPRDLLADNANAGIAVSKEELMRRQRARETGTGIVRYSVDAAGDRAAFLLDEHVYVVDIASRHVVRLEAPADGSSAAAGTAAAARPAPDMAATSPSDAPVSAEISPDGTVVACTTGTRIVAGRLPETLDGATTASWHPATVLELTAAERAAGTVRLGLAEFAAQEEMDRYAGFWWGPDSRTLLVERYDSSAEPLWYISDPANPADGPVAHRYPRALTENAKVSLLAVRIGEAGPLKETSVTTDLGEGGELVERRERRLETKCVAHVEWDAEAYEYLAVVDWQVGHQPVILVQNRAQTDDLVLEIAMPDAETWRRYEHDSRHVALHAARQAEKAEHRAGEQPVESFRQDIQPADDDSEANAAEEGSFPVILTRELERHHNDQWLDLRAGTPAFTPDGRLVGALADMAADTNRLTVDGKPFTPAGWQVRTVLDVDDESVLAVAQLTPQLADPATIPASWLAADGTLPTGERAHDARSHDVVMFGFDGSVHAVTGEPGVWTAGRRGGGLMVAGRSMHGDRLTMTHVYANPGATALAAAGVDDGNDSSGMAAALSTANPDGVAVIENHATVPGFEPHVTFTELGEDGLFAAIVAPSPASPYANMTQLPVLMTPYGGPGFQEVTFDRSAYLDAQWWADQGFLVVIADGHGTTGRGPLWDRAIWHNMKAVTLADQVAAVESLSAAVDGLNRDLDKALDGASATASPESADLATRTAGTAGVGHGRHSAHGRHASAEAAEVPERRHLPRPDLAHVAMIGWSYGGFLSATAVLDAPATFAAACAGAPPTDWTLYDTHYTERYLGLNPATYVKNSIIEDAPQLKRPLMLIHGFADDNVTVAHSLRLSDALMKAGRDHTFLPLTGVTHMTNDPDVARNLLILQRDFLKRALAD